jgi:MFS family permease
MSLRRYFSFPPNLSAPLRSNFINFFWDIGWWGLYTGATAAFLTIYAARCGATTEQIGLLTALPALMTLLISLPVGRWIKGVPAQRATIFSAAAQRGLFLVYALLPWLLPTNLQFGAILGVAMIMVIPNAVIGISFTRMFMEAVPAEWRGSVVGTRMAILSVVSFIVTMICGQILTHMSFPAGYQVVFLIGFVGGIMTLNHITRLHTQSRLDGPPVVHANGKISHFLPVMNEYGRNYIKVVGMLFLFNLTNNMIGPLIPNLLVHKLALSDSMISIGTGLGNILVLIVSLFIARITYRSGNRRATAWGAILLAFQTIFLALAQDAILYLVSVIFAGIASGILNAAQYNYHLENIPPEEQSTWLSWNQMLGNGAVLIGALVGPVLAHSAGAPAALIFFGGLRLAVGLAIWRWG